MRIVQSGCRVGPTEWARRRIVDVAVQEWGVFGFQTLDLRGVRERRLPDGVVPDALNPRLEAPEQDRTIVVYSSDHGEMLGDHELWGKTVPQQASIGVPCIAAGPGIGGGAVSAALASVHDLAATFLDYAGLTVPVDMDSRSLRPLLQGDRSTHRDYVVSGLLDWDLVWDGRYKLVLGREDGPELYDLETDPWEDQNIAADATGELARLQGLLRAELG